MFDNNNLKNADLNKPTIEINTQDQETRIETDEEILEEAKNYIIAIRKRDNDKIKIYEEWVQVPPLGTVEMLNKYYIPNKNMFDSSFYAFLNLTKRINEYISYNEINKKIYNMIETLRQEYVEYKKEYTNHKLDSAGQRGILRRAEALYMITFYVHRRLINKTDRHRLDIPLMLFNYLNEGTDLDKIFDTYSLYLEDDFLRHKEEDRKKLEDFMSKIAIYLSKAEHSAHKNYFKKNE